MTLVPLVQQQVTVAAPVAVGYISIQIPVSIHVQMDSMETPQIGNAKVRNLQNSKS
mgnify:FL=1